MRQDKYLLLLVLRLPASHPFFVPPEYQIARLEQSLRCLFPALDLDAAVGGDAVDVPVESHALLELMGTHPHLLPTCAGLGEEASAQMRKERASSGLLRVLYAGESDSRGLIAAHEAAKLVLQRAAGGEGEVISMKGQDESRVIECIAPNVPCVFVVECDGDGELAFPAKKMVRSLKSASLHGLRYGVLILGKSACNFSAQQLGSAKFKGGQALDATLSGNGGARICDARAVDIEIDDLEEGASPLLCSVSEAVAAGRVALGGTSSKRRENVRPLRRFLTCEVPRLMQAALCQDVEAAGPDAAAGRGDSLIVTLCCPQPGEKAGRGGGTGGAGLNIAVLSVGLPEAAACVKVQVAGAGSGRTLGACLVPQYMYVLSLCVFMRVHACLNPWFAFRAVCIHVWFWGAAVECTHSDVGEREVRQRALAGDAHGV